MSIARWAAAVKGARSLERRSGVATWIRVRSCRGPPGVAISTAPRTPHTTAPYLVFRFDPCSASKSLPSLQSVVRRMISERRRARDSSSVMTVSPTAASFSLPVTAVALGATSLKDGISMREAE